MTPTAHTPNRTSFNACVGRVERGPSGLPGASKECRHHVAGIPGQDAEWSPPSGDEDKFQYRPLVFKRANAGRECDLPMTHPSRFHYDLWRMACADGGGCDVRDYGTKRVFRIEQGCFADTMWCLKCRQWVLLKPVERWHA